ncbi:MAG: class I SAM-dependent rRNA methyltransferase [Pseudomonadota bacterium]
MSKPLNAVYPPIKLSPRIGRRAQSGHPWVYSNEIVMDQDAKALAPGSLVRVMTDSGEALGVAMFNTHSLIAARFLIRDINVTIDRTFLAERLQSALAMREALFAEPYYRLIHAEADGLPGLIVDRLGDVVVMQPNSAGMDRMSGEVIAAIQDCLSPRAIVVRADSPVRHLEGLEERIEVIGDLSEGPISIIENDCHYLADPTAGQKTGWFFDQRDNRRFMAGLARDQSVLDVYAHTGGFGLAAAGSGARAVTMVDRAEAALDLARRAADKNNVTTICTFAQGDAFGDLEARRDRGERFDIVICDPPAFVRTKKDLKSGARGYRKLTRLAARLVDTDGWLAIASCSHHVSEDLLLEQIKLGLRDSGREGRVVRRSGASPDHPIHPALPESTYLKFFCLRLD